MAREKKRGKGKSRKGTGRQRDVIVHLTPTVQFLHRHLSGALCNEVFAGVRTTERERNWSLFALARFWISVVLDPPPALTPVLERLRRGDPRGLLPHVEASAASFFERCKTLNSAFFMALYARFVAEIAAKAPAQYSGDVAHLLTRFSGVSLIDGSKMERIAHRLKILREEHAVILPGCALAVYDLFRGFATQLWFDPDAAAAEHTRALDAVDCLAQDTLLVGDRLHCTLQMFRALDTNRCWGLFRKTKALPVRKLRRLQRRRTDRGLVEDWIVEAGSTADPLELRLFVLKVNGTTYESLTNVLSPERLTLDDAMFLYPKRWRIERLFFDLKIVLKLRKLYCANPNAVAMQLYAGAMVHAALDVARRFRVPADELSPQKLFPLLSIASIKVLEAEFVFEKTCEVNPDVVLRKPSWRDLPDTVVSLGQIRVQRRSSQRRKPEYHKDRAKWKSITKVDGAEEST